MVPVAAILADRELERLLAYLDLPTELPKTAPARSPPFDFEDVGLESQANPLADLNDGIDAPAGEELTPA